MQEWHRDRDGVNYQYKRETLLNYGMSRWGLNKTASVGKISELIRDCAPKEYEEWKSYYFENARQNKRDGIAITEEYLVELGERLYVKLSEVVSSELQSITLEECIDYVYNLVINRTYEGYMTEINTIYGILDQELGCEIQPAPDEWDRCYGVDFFIEVVANAFIGIQIKPVSGRPLNDYTWYHMHQEKHQRFTEEYQGAVFFVLSKTIGGRKQIENREVIDAIGEEISRLRRI